jgi:hypothetical protein
MGEEEFNTIVQGWKKENIYIDEKFIHHDGKGA